MKNRLKVIHVISSPCGGGAELLVRELTKKTNEQSIKCKAIYFNDWADCAKMIDFTDNEHSLNIGFRNPFAVIKLRKIFKTELIGYSSLIAHVHLTWPMLFMPLACLGLPIKLVFTEHSMEHSATNSLRNFFIFKNIEKIFYNRYHSIIAITEGVKYGLVQWLGTSLSNKVSTIVNGARFFYYKERKPLGKCIKFISVGSLISKKGFDRAIVALSQLEGIDWQYEIVGDGSSRHDLEQLIVSYNLQDKVTLSGWSSDLEKKYHNADIQLVPSRLEGFGLVAIEGMSTGLPVIASDLKGINEIVSSSVVSCFLVKDPSNNSEWINKIKLCINSLKKDLPHISKESYQHSQKFSLEKMTKNYIDLYKQVLKDE